MAQRVSSGSERAGTLADTFWTLARQVGHDDNPDPIGVVEQFLVVLAEFTEASPSNPYAQHLSAQSRSLLALLRRHEVEGDLTYASPEQARGEPVDERALVFSVGVLLFERLTGRHPFGADENPNRLARIRRGEMMSGVNYFPKIPAELRAVVVKAIAAFPEERWNNLADLRRQLEAFVQYARGSAPPPRAKRESKLPAVPAVNGRLPSQPLQSLPRGQLPDLDEKFASLADAAEETQDEPTISRRFSVIAGKPVPVAADKRSLLAPMLWMVAGAAGACAIMFAVLSATQAKPTRSGETEAATEVAPEVAPKVVPNTAPAVSPKAAPTVAQAASAIPEKEPPARVPSTAPAKEDSPETAPAKSAVILGDFDIEVGSRTVENALAPCFEGDGGAYYFGASLIYGKSGTASRVYLGGVAKLAANQRQCVQKALVGTKAGGAPEASTVVEYSLVVKSGSVSAKARVKK